MSPSPSKRQKGKYVNFKEESKGISKNVKNQFGGRSLLTSQDGNVSGKPLPTISVTSPSPTEKSRNGRILRDFKVLNQKSLYSLCDVFIGCLLWRPLHEITSSFFAKT